MSRDVSPQILANMYYFFAVMLVPQNHLEAFKHLEIAVSLWPEALHIRSKMALVCHLLDFPLKAQHHLVQLIGFAKGGDLLAEVWLYLQETIDAFFSMAPKIKGQFSRNM